MSLVSLTDKVLFIEVRIGGLGGKFTPQLLGHIAQAVPGNLAFIPLHDVFIPSALSKAFLGDLKRIDQVRTVSKLEVMLLAEFVDGNVPRAEGKDGW